MRTTYRNLRFYELCYNAGMRPANYPIMSVSITEREVKQVLDANHAEYMEGSPERHRRKRSWRFLFFLLKRFFFVQIFP